jgi:hypothetical protein
LASVSSSSKWLYAAPSINSTGFPAARTAAAKSRDCRWNSGVSHVPMAKINGVTSPSR